MGRSARHYGPLMITLSYCYLILRDVAVIPRSIITLSYCYLILRDATAIDCTRMSEYEIHWK
jgi:hypothetical protein